ncbi:MAG: hypothetical protein FD149_2554 [Rhodospirillaceae bacterium]|nr:MAG: hypothetical protein FD149_2554 [Rhodospirillaceae bacterium]
MPAPPIDKLSLVVFSADFAKVHYALMLAGAALAVNTPVTLFFTMGACQALRTVGDDEAAPGAPATGMAGFEELLAAVVALGGRFIVCETGLKAVGLKPQDLRPDVPIDIAGIVTFLADTSREGGMMFI